MTLGVVQYLAAAPNWQAVFLQKQEVERVADDRSIDTYIGLLDDYGVLHIAPVVAWAVLGAPTAGLAPDVAPIVGVVWDHLTFNGGLPHFRILRHGAWDDDLRFLGYLPPGESLQEYLPLVWGEVERLRAGRGVPP